MFGVCGLFAITVFATITANIEVMLLIKAFGLEQTLGNVLFASTFLCTDIASEIYGKKTANKIVNVGICTSILFIILTKFWVTYVPSTNDIASSSMHTLFSNTPRIMIVGLLVYGVCQKFDVWIYHLIWKKTQDLSNSRKKYLWLRNNGSTMLSQLLNTVLFTFGAFYGVYDIPTLISILFSSYIIFLILSLSDTVFLYIARNLHENAKIDEIVLGSK